MACGAQARSERTWLHGRTWRRRCRPCVRRRRLHHRASASHRWTTAEEAPFRQIRIRRMQRQLCRMPGQQPSIQV